MTTAQPGRRWRVPMSGRDAAESHRVSTPLELLFDLTFVVAVSRAAAKLADSLAHGHVGTGLAGYLTVFFAIWWAWMNFTWFASAYDTDDVPYRLLTLLQMAGSLILAAGVDSAFDEHFGEVVLGYVIMRVAMIGQWLRASRSDPVHRRTALRYAGAIAVVQVLWIARLLLPVEPAVSLSSFAVLAAAEIAVPLWAERATMTSWHPHHISERYGLFTIIVLGECVLAASNAISQGARVAGGRTVALGALGISALVLLFALWWLYFLRDAAEGLADRRGEASFRWGYGHLGVFAALAGLGAGLEVAAEALSHEVAASDVAVAFGVAVPVAVFLLLLWWLHEPVATEPGLSAVEVAGAAVATLLLAGAASFLALDVVLPLLAVPSTVLVVLGQRFAHR